MSTARHVIFGTGAIGLATYDALRRRGVTVRLVNRSGHARVPDDVPGGLFELALAFWLLIKGFRPLAPTHGVAAP